MDILYKIVVQGAMIVLIFSGAAILVSGTVWLCIAILADIWDRWVEDMWIDFGEDLWNDWKGRCGNDV